MMLYDQLSNLLSEYDAISKESEEQCLYCFGRTKADVLAEIQGEIDDVEEAINSERRWAQEEEDLAYCRPAYHFCV